MKTVIAAVLVVAGIACAQTFYATSGRNSTARIEHLSEKELADYDAAFASVKRATDKANQVVLEIDRAHHVAECPVMSSTLLIPCAQEFANIHGEWLVIDGPIR